MMRWMVLILVGLTWCQPKKVEVTSGLDTAFIREQVQSLRSEINALDTIHVHSATASPSRHWIAKKADYWGLQDWFIDLLNVALILLNVILVIFVACQLSWARTTVKIMRNTLSQMESDSSSRERFDKLKQRARIRIVFDKNPVKKLYTGDEWFEIEARALNIGPTTASNYRVNAHLRFLNKGQRIQSQRGNYHLDWPTSEILGAGEKSPVFPPQFMEDDTFSICMREEEVALLNSGKFGKRLFCFGHVRFEDIFENRWSQEFCFEVDVRTGDIRKTGYGSNKEISLDAWDYKGALAKEENQPLS